MPQLLERDAQLSRIQALFAGVPRGSGVCVLLGGEAGGGKTALVAALADLLGARADVLVGYCDDLDTPKPLGPLADIARPLDATFAALLHAGAGQADLFDALLDALAVRPRPAFSSSRTCTGPTSRRATSSAFSRAALPACRCCWWRPTATMPGRGPIRCVSCSATCSGRTSCA